ncbi:tetraspanin-9 isoform X1 [Hermetia illucens]|uniref:tetraspanin-9 isoform X1 n=1 Tax=Hermetia illucens TaxID=343691 RepID=UPI0018CC11A5|nr:tetraspanin-9 isoform X1 [Hermetia illucens]
MAENPSSFMETMGKTGYTCIRRTFCWLNIILWICGCAFLGAGVWLRLSYQGYATLLPHHAGLSADSLFISVGVLSFVVSFFGCCGSWFQSRCLLITYFILIVLLFLTEFLIGSIAFLFRGGLGRALANELRYGIENHYNATDRGALAAPSVSAIWDNLQQSLKCCGVTSYEDWYDIDAWKGQRWVPESCCRPQYDGRTFEIVEGSGNTSVKVDCGKSENPALWFDIGCAHALQMWFVQRLHVIGAIGIVIAFLQLFGLITSMLLFCTVKHKRESHTYKSYSPSIDPTTRTSSWED